MPMVVASAYDDNKNLVPLYVSVDGDDFPYQPVSPGFVITGMDGDFTGDGSSTSPYYAQFAITLSAVKPAGGKLDVEGVSSSDDGNFGSLRYVGVRIFNHTSYKLRVIGSFSGNNVDQSIDSIIQPDSSIVSGTDYVTSMNVSCGNCTVQIEES